MTSESSMLKRNTHSTSSTQSTLTTISKQTGKAINILAFSSTGITLDGKSTSSYQVTPPRLWQSSSTPNQRKAKTLHTLTHCQNTVPGYNTLTPQTAPRYSKKTEKLYIQKANKKCLYLARYANSTILTALSSIASQQSNPTKATKRRMTQLLNYIATQEEAIITYSTSNMVFAVHSDASYPSEPNARS